MGIGSRFRQILPELTVILLAALILCVGFSPSLADFGETVTVGFYEEPGMMSGMEEDAVKSGYAYDYLQELASFTSWKYKYVFASWNELYPMLKEGKIDLLPYVSRTKEREKEILYPEMEMGNEHFYIAALTPEHLSADLHELQGRKIGTIKDAFHSKVFAELMEEKGIDCTIVDYSFSEERLASLVNGEIDYSVETSTSTQNIPLYSVFHFGDDYPFYIAFSPKRPDLVREADTAQDRLAKERPEFLNNLYIRYFKASPYFKDFTEEEQNWLSSSKSIRIGAFDNDVPFLIKNRDGTFSGIAAEYVDLLFSSVGVDIPIEWKLYSSNQRALEALNRGEIDLIHPYYRNYADAEREGVIMSGTVYTSTMSLLYLGSYTDTTMDVIATPSTRLGARYVRDNYPDSEIVPCLNGYDCIDKLLQGKANCVVMNTAALREIAQYYPEDFSMKSLNTKAEGSFAALPKNAPLISIINKGAPFVTDQHLNAIENRYFSDENTAITARQFFRLNPGYIIAASVVLIAVGTVIAVMARKKKSDDAYRKQLEEDKRLLQENMEVIVGLANEYLALYYVNLEEHTFKVYSIDGKRLQDTRRLLTQGKDAFELLLKFVDSPAVHPEDRALFADINSRTIAEKLAHQKKLSIRFRRNYGEGFLWSEMDVIKYEPVDEPPNAIAIGFAERDKEIRQEMEQQQQLHEALSLAESASEAKTSFLFNMSHDIRTPMNAIIGFTGMALKHLDDKEKVRDSLQKTRQASDLLLNLINSVLDMSRVESGKVILEEDRENVYESFASVESTLQELASAKHIDLSFSVKDIADPLVYCDRNRCVRVFVNIITNAIKYTNEGGRVKVSCEQIGKEDGYGFYRYTFEDNGIGMSEEFQKHVFEEFTREENSTTSGIQGTGLGLAVCKSFVTLMNGTIECRSRQGEGTTFTIVLPFKIRAKEHAETEPEEADNSNMRIFFGKRTLLVEDNELNREIAVEILEEAGLIVEEAADGSAAVELLKEKGPDYYDFILMDIQMPVMDGYEATREIRKMYPDSALPVIALSANAFTEDRAKSLASGMNDHIAKPIDISEMFQVLSKFV